MYVSLKDVGAHAGVSFQTAGKVLNGKGAAVEITFDSPGTYVYFCDRHQFMRGAITMPQ